MNDLLSQGLTTVVSDSTCLVRNRNRVHPRRRGAEPAGSDTGANLEHTLGWGWPGMRSGR